MWDGICGGGSREARTGLVGLGVLCLGALDARGQTLTGRLSVDCAAVHSTFIDVSQHVRQPADVNLLNGFATPRI